MSGCESLGLCGTRYCSSRTWHQTGRSSTITEYTEAITRPNNNNNNNNNNNSNNNNNK